MSYKIPQKLWERGLYVYDFLNNKDGWSKDCQNRPSECQTLLSLSFVDFPWYFVYVVDRKNRQLELLVWLVMVALSLAHFFN